MGVVDSDLISSMSKSVCDFIVDDTVIAFKIIMIFFVASSLLMSSLLYSFSSPWVFFSVTHEVMI